MCVTQLGKPSAVQAPKTATPGGTPAAPLPLPPPLSLLWEPESLVIFLCCSCWRHTRDLPTRPGIVFHSSRLSAWRPRRQVIPVPIGALKVLYIPCESRSSESCESQAGFAIPTPGRGSGLRERGLSPRTARVGQWRGKDVSVRVSQTPVLSQGSDFTSLSLGFLICDTGVKIPAQQCSCGD